MLSRGSAKTHWTSAFTFSVSTFLKTYSNTAKVGFVCIFKTNYSCYMSMDPHRHFSGPNESPILRPSLLQLRNGRTTQIMQHTGSGWIPGNYSNGGGVLAVALSNCRGWICFSARCFPIFRFRFIVCCFGSPSASTEPGSLFYRKRGYIQMKRRTLRFARFFALCYVSLFNSRIHRNNTLCWQESHTRFWENGFCSFCGLKMAMV